MIVHLDSSVLVEVLTNAAIRAQVHAAISRLDRVAISTVVEYECLRGPRSPEQLTLMRMLFSAERVVAFRTEQAETAARLYRQLSRARSRQMDIMIAACAIEHGAALWTVNPSDFEDIPGLTLYQLP